MSIEVMTEVWKRAPYEGGAMLCLLAMADWADDDGTGIFPTIKKLAVKARLKPRAVQLNLRRLEADGIIVLVQKTSGVPGAPNEWRIDIERLQKMRPLSETSRDEGVPEHNIQGAVGDQTEADQHVADYTPPGDNGNGCKNYTRPEDAEDGCKNDTGVAECTGANITRVQPNAGDGCNGLHPTGAIDDISPTPPNIDIRQSNRHLSASKARAPATPVDNQKPAGQGDDPPEFMRRYSDEFETFWRAYPVPLNSSKADAWKAWQSVERPPLAVLLECAARYAEAVDAENRRRKPNDQRQTCHPATWLRGQRWESFLPRPEAAVTRETTPPWDGHPAGAQLLDEIGPDHFDTWLRPCTLAINDGVPVLTAPSRLIRNRVAADYIDRLERVFGAPVVLQ